jgi:Secretion system C-terminal sorting domain
MLCFTAFASQLTAQNQVPNGNFSTWTDDTTCASWNGTVGVDVMIYTFNLNTILRTADAHSAPYAMMIKTETTVPILGTLVMGCASLGTTTLNLLGGYVFDGGTPINVKPTKLKGYYKYTCPTQDTMAIFGVCMNGADTIGDGYFATDVASSTYGYFEFDFTYTGVLVPDMMNIVAISSAGNVAKTGSTLYIDDLQIEFTGMGGPETMSLEAFINAYPIPNQGSLNIDLIAGEMNLIQLYDLSGRMVYETSVDASTTTIPMNQLENGSYVLRVTNSQGIASRQVILAR